MGTMKSLMLLMQSMFADADISCCTCTTADWKTVSRRVKDEGISFLTISLPTFARDLEKGLALEVVDHTMFAGFSKHGATPRFLGGLLDLIFDRQSGRLLDDPSVTAIFFIRQLTLACKKINLSCTERRTMEASRGFIKCDKEVGTWERSVPQQHIAAFGRICTLLYGTALSDVDRKVAESRVVPRHGPGATADRLVGNGKFDQRTWTHRLEGYFPSLEFLAPNMGFFEVLDDVNFLEPGSELPVKVTAVPKTLKTPRLIAIEPTCMQYAQQGIAREVVKRIESDDLLSKLIGFTDQLPNRVMAQTGSRDGSLATVDLSEASDRVSNLLVKSLLQNVPHLSGAVQACRSLRAKNLDGSIMELSKFASSGSALTFPFEAMVFLAIVFFGIEQKLSRTLTRSDISRFADLVRVYGDDIIVPTDIVLFVVKALEAFGLKVNLHKTFVTGKFRESCGGDYYDGVNVAVTYIRRVFPSRRSDVSEVISIVSLRNQLYFAGLWTATRYLDGYITGLLANFPVVLKNSPALGRHSFLGFKTEKFCEKLHRPLVKAWTVMPSSRTSLLDGPGALLKFFLKEGRDPFFDKRHLERYGRPESVDIKLRWTSPV
jgi:hypothetical protein